MSREYVLRVSLRGLRPAVLADQESVDVVEHVRPDLTDAVDVPLPGHVGVQEGVGSLRGGVGVGADASRVVQNPFAGGEVMEVLCDLVPSEIQDTSVNSGRRTNEQKRTQQKRPTSPHPIRLIP